MNKNPKGVLGENYADRRIKQKELSFRYRVRGQAVVYAMRRYLGEPSKGNVVLLDMGAAEGRTLVYINEQWPLKRGIGIEYNRELMDRAVAMPAHLSLMNGDVTRLTEIPDQSVDVVSALALLEHLPSPAVALREAARILRPGGLFVATSPVPFWDHWSVRLGLLDEDHHECDMYGEFFRGLFGGGSSLTLREFRKFMWAPAGILPYVGMVLDPARSLTLDRQVERLKLFNFLFVNQLAVGVKQ